MALVNFVILRVTVIASLIKFSSGLECYQCRTNLCTHQYCTEANSLLENSGTAMSSESWQKLSTCPEQEERARNEDNEAAYVVTCPKKAIACGRTIFNITATTSKQIVPGGNNSLVPVLGSGTESKNSAVIVYGCVLPSYKSCSPGYSLEYKVPSQAKPNSGQNTLTDVIVTNTKSVCCHCQHDRCNGIEGTLSCDTTYSPQSDPTDETGESGAGFVHAQILVLFLANFILKRIFF